MHHRGTFTVETRGKGLVSITDRVRGVVEHAVRTHGHVDALCTVFIHHTSASLLINENADATVTRDLEAFLSRLVTDGDPLFQHTDEGPDDMPAHVKVALTATSLSIPVVDGKLDLGTWQGVFVWEHRRAPHARRVSVVIVG
jgi:secondary thiamine-phosphate synthase enzyme